jgi:hypothetical protein
MAEAEYGPGVCFDPDPDAADEIAAELGWDVGDLADTLACDVVCTVTPGSVPVVEAEALRPGAHLNLLGADGAGKAEATVEAVERVLRMGRIFCDEWQQASHGGELTAAGYPKTADPRQANMTLLIIILLLFVVAATAVYGPQAAALVEMFPTRVRYTAMSFPYHVGTGWVGGFLPVTSFALVAITGDIYAGVWYPIFFTAVSVVSALLFLRETSGIPID